MKSISRLTLIFSLALFVAGCVPPQDEGQTTAPANGDQHTAAHTEPSTAKEVPARKRVVKQADPSCLTEGHTLNAKSAYKKAHAIYKAGCDKKHARCCKAQGDIMEANGGKVTGYDDTDTRLAAIAAYKKACALKLYKACTLAGQLLSGRADSDRAGAVEETAREGGGDALPKKVVAMKKEALRLLKIACDQNDGEACYGASEIYRQSKDEAGMADKVQAQKYAAKACKLKHKKACN